MTGFREGLINVFLRVSMELPVSEAGRIHLSLMHNIIFQHPVALVNDYIA
jgi:hypothetical protein